MTAVEISGERLAGATKDVKGKIVEHLWELQKQGHKESTVKLRRRLLNILIKRGADLFDPETVKEVLANTNRSDGYKFQLAAAYGSFLSTLGLTWQPPNYRQTQKLPFIPLESELDALIAGMAKRASAFLELLKETAMRKGEAANIRWKDVDTERNLIILNRPEKNSNPRTFKVSSKLIAILRSLPIKGERVFSQNTILYVEQHFFRRRKRLAEKLQNPRLLNISFHTFRHWKATMLYHQTKDILRVQKLLGHRNINNTMLYTQLVEFESDEWNVSTADNLKEACALAEAGFEYFTEIEGVQVFRKRK